MYKAIFFAIVLAFTSACATRHEMPLIALGTNATIDYIYYPDLGIRMSIAVALDSVQSVSFRRQYPNIVEDIARYTNSKEYRDISLSRAIYSTNDTLITSKYRLSVGIISHDSK